MAGNSDGAPSALHALERLRSALQAAGIVVWDLDLVTGRADRSGSSAIVLGIPSGSGADFSLTVHPDDRPDVDTALAAAYGGEQAYDIEFRVIRPDGMVRWLREAASVHRDAAGLPIRLSGVSVDVTERKVSAQTLEQERKSAEERQQLLVAELSHRVKNTLATVQSIATQTLRGAASAADFKETFTARLGALARAHDLLTERAWESTALAAVLQHVLAPYGKRRVAVEGPELRLAPNAALTLTMAFHELATNAAKHGALSIPSGRVSVRWSAPVGTLELEWVERGGPSVHKPRRRGFGLRLIEQGLTYELGGHVRLEFAPDGLECHIRLPLSAKVSLL
jgi:two-component sensor histidine kinase